MDRGGSGDILLFEGFRLDRGGLFRLDQAGVAAPVGLGSRALDLLRLLVERSGELVSKDEIMGTVWPETVVEEGNLTVQISTLRRTLDRDRANGSCIQTVPGRGYRFVARVRRVEPNAPERREPATAARLERRLVAILAADVAGYSRLIGADEEGTLERLKALRTHLIDRKIAEHRGRIVKTTGDGLLVEFSSVVDALRCATEVQATMAQRNVAVPADRRIEFRIGINVGDIVVEDGDIFGDGVNIAARLEALAEPGEICVPARVREDAAGKLDIAFDDLGERQLRHITRPVRVYRVRRDIVAQPLLPGNSLDVPTTGNERSLGLGAVSPIVHAPSVPYWPQRHRRKNGIVAGLLGALALLFILAIASMWHPPWLAKESSTPRLSIVVLPFTNLSDDREQQYFADGITEDLTTDLSRRALMFVISRDSAFTYRSKQADAKQIGRELGVRYLLEGSVRRSGNMVRVNAQLIDAETSAHLWAERFDHAIGDLVRLQDEITGRIAVAVGSELVIAEASRSTKHPDALDYFFRARAALLRPPSRESYQEAIDLFERALALDPGAAEIQGGLANVLVSRALDGLADSFKPDLARAGDLVRQALAASPRNPSAHYARAQLLRARDRTEEAIAEYETVIALDRNFAGAYANLGRSKLLTGSIEETIPLQEQAIRLSPRAPNIGNWYYRIGLVHLLQSRTDEAIIWLKKARAAGPALPYIHAHLASAYALNGDSKRAADALAEARRLAPTGLYSSIAHEKAGVASPAPTVAALYESTYYAGLRKAGMPEE
jgi:adenylate cyclase